MRRLAIVTTHPIQYNAPLFAAISARGILDVKVFYTNSKAIDQIADKDFGVSIKWDITLLQGYNYEIIKNVARDPGSHHFFGIHNPTLLRDISNYDPDGLLVFGWSFRSHLEVLRYFKGKIPIAFRGDSTNLDDNNFLKKAVRRMVLFWIYTHIDHAFATGTMSYRYFISIGLKLDQVSIAKHAVDIARFGAYTNLELIKNFKSKLEITSDELVFLFVGKFIKKKGIDILLKAFSEIRDSNIRLLLVGAGELASLVELYGKQDSRIKSLPFQNQSIMPAIYRLGDALVMPSRGPGETWGLAANEAMACGLPVMMSDKCGGAFDLVTKDTGWMFSANDVEALTMAMQAAVEMRKEGLIEMGQKAREHIQNFTFEKIATAIEDYYLNG